MRSEGSSPTLAVAQRLRAVHAVAEISHESGVTAVTVRDACSLAQIDKASFDILFGGLDNCLRYSFAAAHRQTFAPLVEAEPGGVGLALVEGKLEALYAAVGRSPLLAELCLVHCNAAREESAGNDFDAGVQALARLLSEVGARDNPGTPAFAAGALAQTIVALAALRTRQGRTDQLAFEWREMAEIVAMAYPTLRG